MSETFDVTQSGQKIGAVSSPKNAKVSAVESRKSTNGKPNVSPTVPHPSSTTVPHPSSTTVPHPSSTTVPRSSSSSLPESELDVISSRLVAIEYRLSALEKSMNSQDINHNSDISNLKHAIHKTISAFTEYANPSK